MNLPVKTNEEEEEDHTQPLKLKKNTTSISANKIQPRQDPT